MESVPYILRHVKLECHVGISYRGCITHLHIKDRKQDGPSVALDTRDTPIKE